MINKEVLNEIKSMDGIRDNWSHRRLVSFFSVILKQTKYYITLKPVCPICKKEWKEKTFVYNYLINTETEIQRWISSIMARHFRKHGFNMEKIGSDILTPNLYQCPKCKEKIDGLLQAIAHWLKHELEVL
jgi:predicted Zn-ribbon and HTH transcriptional regulator